MKTKPIARIRKGKKGKKRKGGDDDDDDDDENNLILADLARLNAEAGISGDENAMPTKTSRVVDVHKRL